MATSQKTSRSRATKPYTPEARKEATRVRTTGAPPEPETGLRGWRSFGPADARLRAPARPQPSRLPAPGGQLPPLPLPIPSFDEAEARALLDEGARPQVAIDDTGRPVLRPFPPTLRIRSLRHGCYYLRYVPAGLSFLRQYEYRGTMRVERQGSSFGGNTVASADLYYQRSLILRPPIVFEPRVPIPIPDPGPLVPPTGPIPGPFPGPIGTRPLDGVADASAADNLNPADGIPIFPRGRYTYYLSINQVLEGFAFGNSFTLGFTRYLFNRSTNSFTADGNFTAVMTWKTAPAGYPDAAQYLEGEVRAAGGAVVGTLSMGWVSSYLRRATVEIDRVAASEPPLNSGAGHTWRTIFDEIGWDVTVIQSNANVAEPSGAGWSDAEMHAAMLARRDSSNLDAEWRYHILCVREIDSTPRGIMYDAYATDSNNVPREGIGIATHWVIPNAPPWGRVRGMRFGTATAPYFRTALHEIGHAMGLYHNTVDFGFMNTTDVIASGAAAGTFPDNVKWAHADDDRKRLKHLPDIWVRPGGIPFGLSYGTAPVSPDDRYDAVPGVDFTATPLLPTVPIGAPVRVNLMLTNRTARPLLLPADLSLRGGFVRGKVVDPGGAVRTFSPLILCVDEERMAAVDPEQSVTESLTLLRGGEGALFPMAGTYRISIELDWDAGATTVGATAEAVVMVTPAEDDAHAEAALDVLSEPDTLPAMVIGGDHLVDGVAAIQSAVKNPVLAPHFAIIEAKRVAKSAGKRRAISDDVAALLDGGVVATEPEIRRLAQLVTDARATNGDARKKVAAALKARADDMGAGPETRKALDALEP